MRVLDLATTRAELAGRVLADLGAEVIKVEPATGSAARRLPPFAADSGQSLYWATVALGKRSIVLDLETPADRERLREMIASADLLVESFDPGVMANWGLGYEAM